MNTEKQVFKTRIDKIFFSLYLIMFLLIIAMTIIAYLLPNDSSMFYFMAGFSIVALVFMASAFFCWKLFLKMNSYMFIFFIQSTKSILGQLLRLPLAKQCGSVFINMEPLQRDWSFLQNLKMTFILRQKMKVYFFKNFQK